MSKYMKTQTPSFCISILILFMLSSCSGIKTKLSQSELRWMDVYKEGDTLVFKSENGDFDTSTIIKKELFYPAYNPVEVHDKYLPQWGVIWYKNKNLRYNLEGDKMVTIFKKHPKNNTNLNINYLYSNVMVLNLTTGSIEKYKRDKIYEFDTYKENGRPEQPKKIYWHEDHGIIKYVTHAGIMWERINLPNN